MHVCWDLFCEQAQCLSAHAQEVGEGVKIRSKENAFDGGGQLIVFKNKLIGLYANNINDRQKEKSLFKPSDTRRCLLKGAPLGKRSEKGRAIQKRHFCVRADNPRQCLHRKKGGKENENKNELKVHVFY